MNSDNRKLESWTVRTALTVGRLLAITAAAFGVVAFNTPSIPAQSGPIGTNVLLVTIDTLRADRLGSYGYARARTPVLDGLAARGVRFADATAHAPLTYPSHVTILTGQYQSAFGIRVNGMDPLPDRALTIAERLKSRGYSTGAILGSVVLGRSTGLSQGFDGYDDTIAAAPRSTVALADLQRPAAAVTAAAKAWLASQRAGWFLWVHYYDPHLPYSAPDGFNAAAPGRPYDAEISYVDSQLGVLLESLDLTRTAVVVTSDHGEGLGSHGESDHGFFLYDATLKVPLIVSAPGVKPGVVAEQVRSVDIVPTILDLAGATGVATGLAGESLRPLLDGQTRRDPPVSIAESWYPRLHFGWSELRSARVGEWKYVAAPRPELYDLRTDPGELKNLIKEKPAVAGRLAADLQNAARSSRPQAPAAAAQPDPAAVARLQALGYVGTFAPVTDAAATDDPKDRLKDYQAYRDQFNRALGFLGQERPREAQVILQRLLKMNVRTFEAHLYLGNAYLMQGRHDAALAEYDATSQLNPSFAMPHFEAAKALSNRGDIAAAVTRAEQGLKLDPASFYGYYTLGIIHRRASQWREAFAALSRAVELNGADPRARASLASTAMHLKDFAVARVNYEAMVALNYDLAPAHFNLGLLAAARGDLEEARRRYGLALAADPAFMPAKQALAKLK